MERLKNKVAIVTGAGSGIGRASAIRFAQEGATVVVTDLRAEAAASVAAEIVADGGQAISLGVDVGVDAQIKMMVDETMARFGRIDVLYNNAVNNNRETSSRDQDFLNFDTDVFHTNMRINVLGGVLACKYTIPHMLEQGGGSIIFTSSTSSLAGDASSFTYGASKAALNWYVQTVATTFGKRGVRCNAILPGVILTPSMEMAFADKKDDFLAIHNVPRLGMPDDIAAMAAFLASDESAYVNGTLMRVDGGITCSVPFIAISRNRKKLA